MISDVPAALSALSDIVKRLKELREWQKLEQQEARPEIPPSFRIMTDTVEDVRFQHGLFVNKASEFLNILHKPGVHMTVIERRYYLQRFHCLEEEVRGLDLG